MIKNICKLVWLSFLSISFCQAAIAQDYVGNKIALVKFFGTQRGDYIFPNKSMVDQFGEALSGPRETSEKKEGSITFVTGCRLHSCEEKGAIVYGKDGEIKAAGLTHYACSQNKKYKSGYDCSHDKRFTMFVPLNKKTLSAEISLLEWAHKVAEDAIFEIVTIRN